MPRGKVGSPVAQLTAPITDTSTYIPFNTANLPDDVPNVCTVGTELLFECIWYTSKDAGGVYTTNGGIRGFDGTTARSWIQGSNVARYICEYDMYARKANIEDHETRILQNVSVIAANEARLAKLEDPVYSIDKTTTEPVTLNFTSGNVSDNFVVVSGVIADWTITTGKLSCVGTGTSLRQLSKKALLARSLIGSVKITPATATQSLMLYLGLSATGKNGYRIRVFPGSSNNLVIEKGVNGTWTALTNGTGSVTVAALTEYTLLISRKASGVISATIGATTVTANADTTYPEGYVGIGVYASSGNVTGAKFDDLTITPYVTYADSFATDSTLPRYWLTNTVWGAMECLLSSTANALAVLRSYCYGEGEYNATFLTTTAGKVRVYIRRTSPTFQTGTGYFVEIDTDADTMRWYRYDGATETALGAGATPVTLAVDTQYTAAITVTTAGVMTCTVNGVACEVTDTTYLNYGYFGVGKGADAVEVKIFDVDLFGVEHPCGDVTLNRGVQSGFVDDCSVDSSNEYGIHQSFYEYNTADGCYNLKIFVNSAAALSPSIQNCGNGIYEIDIKPTIQDTLYVITSGIEIASTIASGVYVSGYIVRVSFNKDDKVTITIYKDSATLVAVAMSASAVVGGLLNRWFKLKVAFESPAITAYVYDDTGALVVSVTGSDSGYVSGRFGVTFRPVNAVTGDGRAQYKNLKFIPTDPIRFIGGVNHGARYDTVEHIDLTYQNPYKRGLTELELTTQTTYTTPNLNGVRVGCTNVTDSTRVGEYPFDRLLEQSQTPIDDSVLVDHNSDDVGDWITCSITRNQPNTDNQPVTAISTIAMKPKWGDR